MSLRLGISRLGLSSPKVGAGGPAPTAPAVFTMTQLPYSNQIYPVDALTGGGQNLGSGTVPVTLNVTSAGTIYARRRSASNGTTIVQAPWLVATNQPVGTGAVPISGVDGPAIQSNGTAPAQTNDGYFYLDLSGDGANWQLGTTPIGMGLVLGISGQSLMERGLKMANDATTMASMGITPSPYGRVFASYFGYVPTISTMPWLVPADGTVYDSTVATMLMSYLIRSTGRMVGIIGHAVGQTSITTWQPGQANGDRLLQMLAAAGGKFHAFLWLQGHSDSRDGMSYATYQGYMDTLMAAVNGANSFAGATKVIGSIPYINGAIWGTLDQVRTIRKASSDWAAAHGYPYIDGVDLITSDGVHENQVGGVRLALHWFRALRPFLGLAGDHRGPAISSITRSATMGGNATINLTMRSGATALVSAGVPQARFQVMGTGGLRWNLNALTLGASSLTVTDPNPIEAFDWYFEGFGDNGTGLDGSLNMLWDNHIEADEAAMAITVGRPFAMSVSGPTTTAATMASATYNMTMSGAAYASTSMGQGLSAGNGFAIGPSYPTRTLEATVTVPSAPAGVSVMFSDDRDWVAYNTDGLFRISANGTVFSGVGGATPIGTATHIALCIDATQWHLFVNGVETGTGNLVNAASEGNRGQMTGYCARRLGTTNSAAGPAAGVIVDELRFSKVVRYTSTFTPPTTPFTRDANTLGLYHFDGNGNDAA